MRQNIILCEPFILVYDSEDKETYTKDEVQALVAETETKLKETYGKTELALREEITALQSKGTLTDKERKDLNDRVEQLSTQQKSKEQQAQIERDKLVKAHEKEKKELAEGMESWKNRYVSSTINGSLLSAAAKHNAYNPEQIVRLFGSQTSLVDELDAAGKPTGQLKPIVKIQVKDDKGVMSDLELSPDEAIKAIAEQDDFANLFNDQSKGGRGGSGKGTQTDTKALLLDPKKYREARAAGNI